MGSEKIRLGLFGAAPDTSNMGVSALYKSAISGISKNIENVEFVVFDNGLGLRTESISFEGGVPINIIKFGARGGKKFYRPENLTTMRAMSKFGAVGALLNKGISLIDSCEAILDVSGGDSFSDIYGPKRFYNVGSTKELAINRKKKLILLPQTYGPYANKRTRILAEKYVKYASYAWARDEDSFEILKSLLSRNYDLKKHACGVDMAFGLQPINADDKLDNELKSVIKNDKNIIGINVSGLIYNDIKSQRSNYGFIADYNKIIEKLIIWLLENTSAKIILVPHVMSETGNFESDNDACIAVVGKLNPEYKKRVYISPKTLNESEVKWLISNFDWFCGTRMHSTIAGLSSCVPTSAISYSDKTKGVFDTCGQGKHVHDPRIFTTSELIENLISSYQNRTSKDELQKKIDIVTQTHNEMMSKISDYVSGL